MIKIPLVRYTFVNEQETKKRLSEFILESDQLSMGKNCRDFEQKFAQWQGRKHAVLFNSGGSSNLAIFQSLKNLGILKDGDKVGVSSLTWSTNVMPIIQLGLKPVALDVSLDTINVMSDNLIERIESENIDAFFITNILGFAGDLEKIREICNQRNIILLEDNCESLGCQLPGGKAGNFSEMASFSFFVSHQMSTIEGGMVCTDDSEMADMLRIVRANGWGRNVSNAKQNDLSKKYKIPKFNAPYSFFDLGYNLRSTEITGFLGLCQLDYLESSLDQRKINYLLIEQAIKANPELIAVKYDHIDRIVPFAIPVICNSPELRDKYINRFMNAGVEIRPLIAGNIQKQPFYQKYVKKLYNLINADFLDQCAFYCGNCPEFTTDELAIISKCLRP